MAHCDILRCRTNLVAMGGKADVAFVESRRRRLWVHGLNYLAYCGPIAPNNAALASSPGEGRRVLARTQFGIRRGSAIHNSLL